MGAVKRLLFCSFGSLGDLHPHIAMAETARRRGIPCAIASSPNYADKVRALGIPFYALGPDTSHLLRDQNFVKKVLNLRQGSEFLLREIVFPSLRATFDDLNAATADGDVLVSHSLVMAARLVAELRGLSWASSVLQPMTFFSAYDPPLMPQIPWLGSLEFLGPRFFRPVLAVVKRAVSRWSSPWHDLRRDLGLARTNDNPVFEGQHAPSLVLAQFSRSFASPQPDWPPHTAITGFTFFDQDGAAELPPRLTEFLNRGPAPLVFTLGSAAIHDAGSFYDVSAAAARALKRRAVFLLGKEAGNSVSGESADSISLDYAPFSQVFPRALAIVHQGGIGTTAQALRARRPSLVVPYGHDQPDNARRVVRLGAGLSLDRGLYAEDRASRLLSQLIGEERFLANAARTGAAIAAEDGAGAAIQALVNTFKVPA